MAPSVRGSDINFRIETDPERRGKVVKQCEPVDF